MSPEQWIEAFAEAAGMPAPSEVERRELLELAAIAAHSSERIAAPIACWIAGRAGLDLDAARAIAERIGEPADAAG